MTPAELDAIEARAKHTLAYAEEVGECRSSCDEDILPLIAEVRRLQAENDRLGRLIPDWEPPYNDGGP